MPDILGTHVVKQHTYDTKASLWRKNGGKATLWLVIVVAAALIAAGAIYVLPQYL